MGKENQRPPASRFLFIITPLFPHCTPLSACVLCVLVGLYPSRLLRLDVFTTYNGYITDFFEFYRFSTCLRTKFLIVS